MFKLTAALSMCIVSTPVLAHSGHALISAQAGFLHPFSGFDHLLVMVAVGLWAGHIGGNARFQLPLTFAIVMTVGAVIGVQGWVLPSLELWLTVSVLAMGLVIALQAPIARPLQFGLVSGFALLHGLAHGSELAGQNDLATGAGMLLATLLLHIAGLALTRGRLALASSMQRGLGGVIAASGAWLLIA